jgi:hypothetical protein
VCSGVSTTTACVAWACRPGAVVAGARVAQGGGAIAAAAVWGRDPSPSAAGAWRRRAVAVQRRKRRRLCGALRSTMHHVACMGMSHRGCGGWGARCLTREAARSPGPQRRGGEGSRPLTVRDGSLHDGECCAAANGAARAAVWLAWQRVRGWRQRPRRGLCGSSHSSAAASPLTSAKVHEGGDGRAGLRGAVGRPARKLPGMSCAAGREGRKLTGYAATACLPAR